MNSRCSRRVQLTQVARTQVGWPSWSLCFAISLAAYEALQHRRRVRNGLRNKVIVKEDHGWRPREAERWSQRDGDAATDDGLKAKLGKSDGEGDGGCAAAGGKTLPASSGRASVAQQAR